MDRYLSQFCPRLFSFSSVRNLKMLFRDKLNHLSFTVPTIWTQETALKRKENWTSKIKFLPLKRKSKAGSRWEESRSADVGGPFHNRTWVILDFFHVPFLHCACTWKEKSIFYSFIRKMILLDVQKKPVVWEIIFLKSKN